MKHFVNVVAFVVFVSVPVFAQKKGDVVVAIRQTELKTSTFLVKLPVEAQRGERWEILKYSKGKVVLTFGPQDERRAISAQVGKTFGYELDGKTFSESFVSESDWPNVRKTLAFELQKRVANLSPEQCEKLIEGGLWIGMSRDHAIEAVGKRILKKEASETAEGRTEKWSVGAFSMMTTAKSTAASEIGIVADITASPSRPREPLLVTHERNVERNIRKVLTFKDGVLAEIVTR